MHGIFVEKHTLHGHPLSWHLARHICSHGQQGKIAVVTDIPDALLAATRRQWLKLLRQAQNERSGTLNATRADLLTEQILWMQGVSFTSKAPDDILEADITFATADDFVRVPPICRCVYVTYTFEREKLHMLTAWMPGNSLVVLYE
ncbi:MAG TPA: hypothetical protein VFM05_09810 [Candidatus Saccharimonadales bacterium]|nr:hypothetical protein [Candidatus Saccharimonadales bacterium]